MRVTHKVFYFPDVIQLEDIAETVVDDAVTQEPISEGFNNIVFQHIEPGLERATVILKAQGLTYNEIAWVFGLHVSKIHQALYRVRNRLMKADLKKYLQNPFLQNGEANIKINNLTK